MRGPLIAFPMHPNAPVTVWVVKYRILRQKSDGQPFLPLILTVSLEGEAKMLKVGFLAVTYQSFG